MNPTVQTAVVTAAQVIGAAEVDLTAIQDIFNDTPAGSFFHVRGYEAKNGHGEVADYFLQHGINYPSIKIKSELLLVAIQNGVGFDGVKVRHGIWIHPDDLEKLTSNENALGLASHAERIVVKFKYEGQAGGATVQVEKEVSIPVTSMEFFSNRKGKGRIPAEVSYTLQSGNSLLNDAVEAALEGIRNPKQVDQGYDPFAKGGYFKSKDGQVKLYIRDCLRVHKIVRVKGEYPFKASLPKSAVRQAVERLTPKGKYRAFLLDGRFEDVTMGGVSILIDEIDESMYIADPDAYKKARVETAEANA
tara:strand:+ start:1008 stop:1919 length:912 start_codon:yes stop_codon:yes gene_type:complete